MTRDHDPRRGPRHASDDVDDDLPALRAPGDRGRRSDDAFARSVRGDVDAVRAARAGGLAAAFGLRGRGWLALPALAVAGAAAFVVVGRPGITNDVRADGRVADDRNTIALATFEALAADDDATVAFVDVDDADVFDDDTLLALAGEPDGSGDSGNLFAIPALDGSTDSELEDVEAALDRALKL